MRHQDLTINHILESFVYANAAARNAATGFVAGDIGRIAFQTDTGQYWRLTAAGPPSGWGRITAAPFASLQTGVITPGAVSSLSGVMAGLSGIITPAVTGKLLVTICGSGRSDTAGAGAQMQIRYGAGLTGPAFGAAPTGTAIGGLAYFNSATANARSPFSITAAITGLTVGNPVWIDLTVIAITAGNVILANIAISASEMP